MESLDTNYDFHESKNVDVGNMVVYKYMYILTCMHTSYISMEKNQFTAKSHLSVSINLTMFTKLTTKSMGL